MLKDLKSTLLIVGVCIPSILAVTSKAQAYESWEIPFSNETFNAPMQREQGGQEYGNKWCKDVWDKRSSWKPYVASVDGRQIATLSVNHIWYHWNNRQCIANINGTAIAPESKNVPFFSDSTDTFTYTPTAPTDTFTYAPTAPTDTFTYAPTAPTDTFTYAPIAPTDTFTYEPIAPTDTFTYAPTAPTDTFTYAPTAPKSQEVSTLHVQDSDLDYNCRSVYGSQAYLSDSRGASDLFICKAPSAGTHSVSAGFPGGVGYQYTTPNGETVEKPALSKKHLCGNAAVNAHGGDRSNITDWRYDGSSNQCYMTINVFQ